MTVSPPSPSSFLVNPVITDEKISKDLDLDSPSAELGLEQLDPSLSDIVDGAFDEFTLASFTGSESSTTSSHFFRQWTRQKISLNIVYIFLIILVPILYLAFSCMKNKQIKRKTTSSRYSHHLWVIMKLRAWFAENHLFECSFYTYFSWFNSILCDKLNTWSFIFHSFYFLIDCES